MRDIKFRAWSIFHRKMMKPFNVIDRLLSCQNWEYLDNKDNWIFMQFIGLHDKNGKILDWWEGDLFRVGSPSDVKYCYYQIIEEQGCFWLLNLKNKEKWPAHQVINWIALPEKIGNVHENKDLL